MRTGHGYSSLRKSRSAAEGYTYLVTTRAVRQRSLTAPPEIPDIICRNLLWIRDHHRMALHAFVLMPDHRHIVITPQHDETLARIMHTVKSYSAQRVNAALGVSGPLWQDGYHERGVRGQRVMRAMVEYVEGNPVRAGLVNCPGQWPYSSANDDYSDLMDEW